MSERCVGIRELKSKLSQCVREVKGGSSLVVTEHGRRVARLVPDRASLEERIEALRTAAVIEWNGRRLQAVKPAVRVRGRRTLADVVVANRK